MDSNEIYLRRYLNDLPLTEPVPTIIEPAFVESWIPTADGHPERSNITDESLAIDDDELEETFAIMGFRFARSGVFYGIIFISQFQEPDPLQTLATATIHVVSQYVPGISVNAPGIVRAEICNARNTSWFNTSNTIDTLGLGGGLSPVAKAESTKTYTAIEFAAAFPGGAADIWVRCFQADSGNFDCSPDVLLYIYNVRITYTYV